MQATAVRLASGLSAGFAAMAKRTVLGFSLSAAAGLAVGIATHEPLAGAAVGAALSALAGLVAFYPLVDPTFRAAAELYDDHNCHERAEWRTQTGTPMPQGLVAVEKWLVAHPTSDHRAQLLLILGRVAEADAAIAATDPRTPDQVFELELLRQTRSLYVGSSPPDIDRLRAAWTMIPEPREGRHRRECLALFEAQVAVGRHEDPILVLAAARAEIPEVYWSMRAPVLVAKWSLMAVLLIAIATAASAVVVRALVLW